MSLSPQIFEEKPYNRCLNCANIGKKCDGPNFLAMSTERRSEWMRLRKEYLHNTEPDKWTNSYIADAAGVSKVTVSRVFSGDMKDIRISTIEAILKVLVNGSWGQYPCAMENAPEAEIVYMDSPELVKRAEVAEAECARLRETLEKLTAENKVELTAAHEADEKRVEYLKEQIKFKDEQMHQKDKLLDERYEFIKRKDRYIFILAVLLFLALGTIITALIVDRLNYDLGFFWRAAFDFGRSGIQGFGVNI